MKDNYEITAAMMGNFCAKMASIAIASYGTLMYLDEYE
jgi:hypothetical protein